MKKFYRNIIATLAISLAPQVIAAEVNIYGLDIPGLHQKDGNGVYDQVIGALQKEGVETKLSVMPPNRAFKMLENCASCCVSPANKSAEFYEYGQDYVTTDAMFTAKIFAWTLPDTPPISDLSDLKGKKVGARTGMPYGKSIDKSGVKLALVPTIETNIKKLKSGRIDAFIAYTPDAFTAFENSGEAVFSHANQKPLAEHPDQVLCKKSPETEAFVKSFNNALSNMSQNGSLANIVGEQN